MFKLASMNAYQHRPATAEPRHATLSVQHSQHYSKVKGHHFRIIWT